MDNPLRKYWYLWAGGALALVYILTRKAPACPATPTASGLPGSDVSSLITQLQASITAQNQQLAQLDTQNATTLLQGLQGGLAQVDTDLLTGLGQLDKSVTQGFATLKPPTIQSAFNTTGPFDPGTSGTEGSGHQARLDTNQQQQSLICQLAAAFPSVFNPPGVDVNTGNRIGNFCKGIPAQVQAAAPGG